MNEDLNTGEIEVYITEMNILNRANTPFTPAEGEGG